jgi:hypothetical protein
MPEAKDPERSTGHDEGGTPDVHSTLRPAKPPRLTEDKWGGHGRAMRSGAQEEVWFLPWVVVLHALVAQVMRRRTIALQKVGQNGDGIITRWACERARL